MHWEKRWSKRLYAGYNFMVEKICQNIENWYDFSWLSTNEKVYVQSTIQIEENEMTNSWKSNRFLRLLFECLKRK